MTPIPPIFEGQAVALVAGGPSLRGFDFERLRGFPVIAINRALEVLPFAHVLWWTDASFWRRRRDAIMAHRAIWKATCQTHYHETDALPESVIQYRFTGHQGFDEDPRCLRSGNNSTYAAMHLLAHQRPARIVLFGVDMQHGPAGETHFHDGHGLPHTESTLTNLMLPYFEGLVAPLAARGIEVINASPQSALRLWPRCSIDEGLACLESPSSANSPSSSCSAPASSMTS